MNKKLNTLLSNGEFQNKNISILKENNFANIFNVINKGKNSYFNLSKNLSFSNLNSIDSTMFSSYLVNENDCWTTISYKMYGTIELWWLIAKFNNVKNPFTELIPGTYLNIPNDTIKESVLAAIKIS